MRTWLSYVLLLCLALSGLSGSVRVAHAYTLADAIQQQHNQDSTPSNANMPCHGAAKTFDNAITTTDHTAKVSTDASHDCCDQPLQQCDGDCCAKHCAAGGALLATELFRYIRPLAIANNNPTTLPQWLFAAEPPPPINA